MMWSSPRFWWRSPGNLARALTPLSRAYAKIANYRAARITPETFSVPILCIGNVTLGGAGKTPFTIALGEQLRAQGKLVHAVSRGYGGRLEGPVRVDPYTHRYGDVGDEPLLIGRHMPCWVAHDRRNAIRAAIDSGAELILMDDGLQNPSVAKSLSFLVMDGGAGIGNGMIFPAGPLRELLASGLERTAAVIMIGEDATGVSEHIERPIYHGNMVLDAGTLSTLTKPVLAFAGIGRPEKFFTSLRQAGVTVAATRSFPDHHPYSLREIQHLREEAADADVLLVTTEKDHLRLPPVVRESIIPVPVRLKLDNWPAVLTLIETLKE